MQEIQLQLQPRLTEHSAEPLWHVQLLKLELEHADLLGALAAKEAAQLLCGVDAFAAMFLAGGVSKNLEKQQPVSNLLRAWSN